MSTIQSQIMDKAVSLLNAAGAAMTPQVKAWRCRVEPFDPQIPGDLPAWNVIPEDGEPDLPNSYSGATARKFRFCVRCTVSANNQADAAADPLYAAAVPALLTDPTLGGLVTFTREGTQKWEKEGPAATDNLALVVSFETEFATSRTDPTVRMA